MLNTYLNRNKSKEFYNTYKPIFYRLNSENDKTALSSLLRENSQIVVFDELYGQLKELIKLLNPTRKLN
ncbi:MAG TPA: hypothetical protein VK766_11545, partial [Cytophagaceae bacterium]|nr:hypothetical protein [Cytophagaceae bacterium]